jgi:predicted GH43/DUF377 family glycosyl hydrolase
MSFSSRFGESPAANQALWRRDPGNPVIAAGADWCPEFIAPCSVLEEDGRFVLYVEGGESEQERIGAYACDGPCDASAQWVPHHANPILRPADDGFDRGSVFDPAVIRFGDTVRLYYSATIGGAHEFAESAPDESEAPAAPEYVGLAHATEIGFERMTSPVLEGRCPAVVEWQGVLYLFYVKIVRGGYRIFLATSHDGVTFANTTSEPVLDVGSPGEWDSYTVTTPKVFRDGDHFTMLYAADSDLIDDPSGLGVAVSTNLIDWTRHPGNPVFTTGAPGAFDSVSVASAIPIRCGDGWQILYGGSDRSVAEGLHSQVGRAWLAP